MPQTIFSPIEKAFEDLRAGRFIILVDDEDRENEGDLVIAAEKITPDNVNFMLKHARGVLCLPMSRQRCEELNIPLQNSENTTKFGTAFTVTIDAHERFGVTTGVSSWDRAKTIEVASSDDCRPTDLSRPGHINPLQARDGGVLVRAGQTEGSVDLCRMAGLKDMAVIIEIMNDDGTMSRLPQLRELSELHGINIYTVADIIEYRMQRENFIKRGMTTSLATQYGEFQLIEYRSPIDHDPHLALCLGGIGELDDSGQPVHQDEPVLLRVASECMMGHVFHSMHCNCGQQLDTAMRQIARVGRGALIYLRKAGRGIGLHERAQSEDTSATPPPAEQRDFGVGAQIVRDLGLSKVRLLTNHPKKVGQLAVYGVDVVEQIPIALDRS